MNDFLTKLSDDELIEKYREGEKHAFDVLLERYVPHIMYWIRQSTNNEDDVADLFQEVSLRIALKLKSVYQGRGYFPAWIHCVVCNYLHSVYRKKRPKIVELDDSLMNSRKLVQEDEPDGIPEKYLSLLPYVLKTQPKHLQKIIWMRFWENCTYQEIADITGINISTIVKRLKTAYRKLRILIEKKGGEWSF